MPRPHPLTDVGPQRPTLGTYSSRRCWADLGGDPYGCDATVTDENALGLCNRHRLEVVGNTTVPVREP